MVGGDRSLNKPAIPSTNKEINMGDKSPKAQRKNKNQKQSKSDANDKAKAQSIANKQQSGLAAFKKK